MNEHLRIRFDNPALGIRGQSPGDVNNSVAIQYSKVPNIEGSMDVSEIYGELLIPLLANDTIDQLNMSVAGRHADYSGSGDVWAWKVGIDAQINEVYWALYAIEAGTVRSLVHGPGVCKPSDLDPSLASFTVAGVGNGFCLADAFSAGFTTGMNPIAADILPAARDLVPLALERLARGETQTPEEVSPVYVREEVSWKKLSEQGKPQ